MAAALLHQNYETDRSELVETPLFGDVKRWGWRDCSVGKSCGHTVTFGSQLPCENLEAPALAAAPELWGQDGFDLVAAAGQENRIQLHRWSCGCFQPEAKEHLSEDVKFQQLLGRCKEIKPIRGLE